MTSFEDARTAMVDCQVRPSDVTRYTVIDAMLTVQRENFVPANYRDVAYAGEHIAISQSRVVLDPRVTAKLLDLAAIGPEDLVLHIGCGYGYLSALIAHMADFVVAIDNDEDRVRQASQNLADGEFDNVVVETGELSVGAANHGPYDVVVIEGAIEQLPETIADQVKLGGRIVSIFAENGVGQCRMGQKTKTGITWRRAFDATAPVIPGFEAEKAFEF